MSNIKIAYLPLYIKLYDDEKATARIPMVNYMKTLVNMIESQGFDVVMPEDICRTKEEFAAAAEKFNADPDIVAVVTQHLAYSPSLESIKALLSLKAPIVILDTTPDYDLLAEANIRDLTMNNHGIHGVQDMCNMLKKNGKPYTICAGHAFHSDVIARVCANCRAAAAAKAFKTIKVGKVGGTFEGMGDFCITEQRYREDIGAEVVHLTKQDMENYLANVTDADVAAEQKADLAIFDVEATNKENYDAVTKTGLALRAWANDNGLGAMTVNFMHIDQEGLLKMPFPECCKTMKRGLGYAGEGDVLTAGLVGALLSVYPNTSFIEMFSPDWNHDLILLSHMGEMNPNLTAWKPVMSDTRFVYNPTGDTVTVSGCFRKGKAVLVNLAPMNDSFTLVLADVEMTDDGLPYGGYRYAVQGWLKPNMPVGEFLTKYSEIGGTHHSALVYDGDIAELAAFGKMMGFDVAVVK